MDGTERKKNADTRKFPQTACTGDIMYDDRTEGFTQGKICVVCGDRALSCNFGAITCESCKAFFRRHAHKEIYGQCDGTCPITVETRSYCRRCRLAKCFSVGMKKDLILSEEQKQRRRQKILENRSKRQTQEVFPPDSTSIQQDLSRLKTSNPAGSSSISPNRTVAFDRVPGATNAWINPPLVSAPDNLTADTSAVPKRDIWEIQNNPSDVDGVKRLAFEASNAGLARLPDGGTKHKDAFDGATELVTSSNPLEDSSSQSSTGGSNQGLTLPVTICMPSSQISPATSIGQTGLTVPVNKCPSLAGGATALTNESGSQQVKIEDTDTAAMLKVIEQRQPKMDCNIIRALSEPCFFNLKPPSLDSKAYEVLEPHIQQRLMLCVEAYREFCRPMVSIHEKVPQNYVSLLNSGEECYHQLVRFAKRLPEFRALSQDDQIALLKGNVIEIMIVRFSKCYNLEMNAWTIPHCGTVQNVSGMIDDDNAMFSEFCIDDYSNFVRAALECCKGDDLILIVLQVITLFWPHIANLDDVASVRAAYTMYLNTLESYLNVMYLDSNMVIEVNKVMGQLRQVGKKAHDVMWKSQVSDLHPLLKEMFNLK